MSCVLLFASIIQYLNFGISSQLRDTSTQNFFYQVKKRWGERVTMSPVYLEIEKVYLPTINGYGEESWLMDHLNQMRKFSTKDKEIEDLEQKLPIKSVKGFWDVNFWATFLLKHLLFKRLMALEVKKMQSLMPLLLIKPLCSLEKMWDMTKSKISIIILVTILCLNIARVMCINYQIMLALWTLWIKIVVLEL